MMGKPTNLRGPRRLLLGLLLGTLLLSTGLNLYLLCQEPAFLAGYDLDASLLESATELELLQTRQALVECQTGHLRTTAAAPADTLALPLLPLTP